MKKTIILWSVIILLLFSTLLLIGLKKEYINKEYKAFENDIIEAAKVYYGQDTNLKKLPNKNETISISIDELKNYGIKLDKNINNDICDGRVEVTGKSISYIYKAKIKCNNYETK